MTETEDGYRGQSVDPSGLITDQFPNPFSATGSQEINAAASHEFAFTIDDALFVYYIRKVIVTPQANTVIMASLSVQGTEYGAKVAVGNVELDYGEQTPIYLVDGDSFSVTVSNLDASARTCLVRVIGVKVARPGGLGRAPAAAFSADITSCLLGEAIEFTDESTYNPTSWEWDFGDDTEVSSEQNPSHTYAEVGTYNVVLRVNNEYGYDIIVKNDYIVVHDQFLFTSFTEVDPGSHLAVTDDEVNVAAIPYSSHDYLYYDDGVNNINDYAVEFAIKVTADTSESICGVFAITNNAGYWLELTGFYIMVFVYRSSTYGRRLWLGAYNGASTVASDYMSYAVNTTYYCRLVREADAAIVRLYVYSDSDRTTLIDTLVVNHDSINMRHQYYMATIGNGSSLSTTISFLLNDFDM